ncbi:hypothetical protein [Rhodocista pekingensis]|uniref:Transcriptional regulator n=1 Tax=Rhodocista pekingensis TaxID=201185 RepID=A0ABW2KT02_9PROT
MATKSAPPNDNAYDDTLERTAVVMYALLEQLHEVLADSGKPDDVNLGMLMGLTMYLDDRIGPFRAERLMASSPSIILKTDAHVVREQLDQFLPVLNAFGEHLAKLEPTARTRNLEPAR